MAYTIDKTGDVIINGFENGIADSPYSGIADMRNVNTISIPGEASVNFATSQISYSSPGTGTVTSADTGTDTITYSSLPTVLARMAVTFSASTIAGVSINTVYWLGNTGATSSKLYSDPTLNNLIDITSGGTGTFSFVTMTGFPKYFTQDYTGTYWCVDSTGRVWTNYVTISGGYWTFSGNTTLTNANGNGLVGYTTSDGTTTDGYIFVFRNGLIDYLKIQSTLSWVYGWKPSDGTTANTGTVLKTTAGTNNPHEALVAPDNKIYYTDSNWIGRWYQADPAVRFVPTTPTTYVFDETQVLPFTDLAQCIAPLGNNLLIGGVKNIVYPWDTFSSLPSYPIMIAESNIVKLVTVNTNTFIFVGNRGRIYYTNGSQASLYKKIPDHISGTVEPYFTWGGACSNKNQLYFSALCTTNSGTSVSQYGGVWAIDLDTKALRLTNKLSYGSYNGYATAIFAQTPYSVSINPTGSGLYIGWYDGVSAYGIDATISTLYANDQTTIDSDLIPIGTFLKPTTHGRVEFKLAVPMVSGDSIQLSYRQAFSSSFANVGSIFVYNTNGAGTTYSGVVQDVNFENSQWIQIRATLNASSSNPSYVRLTELRLGN